jgi:hypothetical protein
MPDVTASRTLVKSAPELWTECSDADSLGRHLEGFGDIRITRLEPESTVAWEGEHGRGTVTLEPSGWGTRVVLTATPAPASGGGAEVVAVAPEPEPVVVEAVAPEPEAVAPEPEPVEPEPAPVEPEPEPEPRRPGFFARLFGRRRRPPVAVEAPAEPESVVEPEPPVEASPPLRLATTIITLESPAAPPEPEVAPGASTDTKAALLAALDSLGQAHHRPYSRS